MSDYVPAGLSTNRETAAVSGATRWLAFDRNGWLVAFAAVYALVYLCFWPPIYTTQDEASYFGNAYVLRQGTIYSDVAGVSVATNFPVGGHWISKYPLGMAALIAVLSLGGWRFALGVNLIVHLLCFAVVVRLLRRARVPVQFALLYLLHPTAILYSRSAMSDLFSGLMIALAFDAYLRGRPAVTGLFASLSLAVRTGNAFVLPAFAAGILLDKRGESDDGAAQSASLWGRVRGLALFAAGCVPGIALAAWYMVWVARGQMASNTGTFSLGYFPNMFPAYAVALLLIYPGLLVAPLLYRGPGRVTAACLCYGCLLLYSFWFYRDIGQSFAETVVMTQRYFLAVLPVWVVTYAEVLWRLTFRRSAGRALNLACASAAAALSAAGLVIHLKHTAFLASQAAVRDQVFAVTGPEDRIICNLMVAKLLPPAWGQRQVSIVTDLEHDVDTAGDWVSAAHGSGRLVLARWTRGGRANDERECALVDEIGRALTRQGATARRQDVSVPGLRIDFIDNVNNVERIDGRTTAAPATTAPQASASVDSKGSAEYATR